MANFDTNHRIKVYLEGDKMNQIITKIKRGYTLVCNTSILGYGFLIMYGLVFLSSILILENTTALNKIEICLICIGITTVITAFLYIYLCYICNSLLKTRGS